MPGWYNGNWRCTWIPCRTAGTYLNPQGLVQVGDANLFPHLWYSFLLLHSFCIFRWKCFILDKSRKTIRNCAYTDTVYIYILYAVCIFFWFRVQPLKDQIESKAEGGLMMPPRLRHRLGLVLTPTVKMLRWCGVVPSPVWNDPDDHQMTLAAFAVC